MFAAFCAISGVTVFLKNSSSFKFAFVLSARYDSNSGGPNNICL